jgi:hypothetical protein
MRPVGGWHASQPLQMAVMVETSDALGASTLIPTPNRTLTLTLSLPLALALTQPKPYAQSYPLYPDP